MGIHVFGVRHRVIGREVCDILKVHNAVIIKGQAAENSL